MDVVVVVVVVSQKEVNSASLKGLRYLIIKLRKIINCFTIIVIILIKVVVIIERLNMKLIIVMVIATAIAIILAATAAIIKIAGLTITELIAFACSSFGGESINWFAVEIGEQN